MPANKTPEANSSGKLERSTFLALIAMGLAVIIIANDFTALSVALPSIEKTFHSDLSTVQWVINAYALVFGVFIVTGGRLADMYGRRRVFLIGAIIFATFSLAGGLSPDVVWLIAARALMGIGGALMWPAILGMTFDVLPEEKAGLAGGLILGAAGFGNALGPMIGGILTDALSWRWIFFVNLPIVAIGVGATLFAIKPDGPVAEHDRLDYAGVALITLGLLAFLVALDQSSSWGWGSPHVIGLILIAVALLFGFAWVERRSGDTALVPRAVMASRDFSAACLSVLLMSAVFFAALLYLPQFMTKQLGFTALRGGVGLLPMMATFAAVSFMAGPLYQRFGAKTIVTVGALCITVGMLLLAMISSSDGYRALVPGMFVLGAGIGLFYSSVTTAGVTALDPSHASLAGGIIYMFQVGGGSVGLGVNTVIVLAAGHSLTEFVDGISHAFYFDALLALCGTAVAAAFVGGRLRVRLPGSHRESEQVVTGPTELN